jgi:hypothetical protein
MMPLTLGLFYGIFAPLLVVQGLALLFIPAMLNTGAKVPSVGKAIYCYLLQTVGITLMSLSGIPALWSVLASASFSTSIYLLLLITFTIGGLIFLWHDSISHTIDEASRGIPHTIYFYSFKLLGFLFMVLSALYMIYIMLMFPAQEGSWWVLPAIILAYGFLLSWCTRWPRDHTDMFERSPMIRPPTPPVHPMMKAPPVVAPVKAAPTMPKPKLKGPVVPPKKRKSNLIA